ncbi:hypothetical protein B0H12DRAFT_1236825 [Mycena haematopus]|nr:hypothetical protein B0H12DRAFT_1236825 [Mycena haematopus]
MSALPYHLRLEERRRTVEPLRLGRSCGILRTYRPHYLFGSSALLVRVCGWDGGRRDDWAVAGIGEGEVVSSHGASAASTDNQCRSLLPSDAHLAAVGRPDHACTNPAPSWPEEPKTPVPASPSGARPPLQSHILGDLSPQPTPYLRAHADFLFAFSAARPGVLRMRGFEAEKMEGRRTEKETRCFPEPTSSLSEAHSSFLAMSSPADTLS